MAVSVSNLVVDQNSDFSTTVLLQDSSGNPLDLTGYTAVGKIKKYYGSNTFVSLTISMPMPLTSGTVTLSLDKVTTKHMEIGRYVYDVKLIDNMNVTKKVLEGIVTVNGGVS
jgi:hypothetical protein